MFRRRLGRSNLEVSALGLGCWAIGGPWDWLEANGSTAPVGWGRIDDADSIRAMQRALEAGINFFDTAAYDRASSNRTGLGTGMLNR